jgi:hypothetical protein
MYDLGSMQNEHDEAKRYAEVYMKDGEQAAISRRKPTRNTVYEDGASTPRRELNFFDASMIVTSLALNAVVGELLSRRETFAIQCLESIFDYLNIEDSQRDEMGKALFRTLGPRHLFEELYVRGYKDGVVTDGKQNVNMLTLANKLAEKRYQ